MNILQLIRIQSNDEGTLGRLDGKYYTIELPWRDINNDGVGDQTTSCITPGSYLCQWTNHPKHGWCYEVKNVKGRFAILIHPGNYAGDIAKGYRSDFEGCIGLGSDIARATAQGFSKEQEIITSSRTTIALFNTAMNKQDFTLEIIDNIDHQDKEFVGAL